MNLDFNLRNLFFLVIIFLLYHVDSFSQFRNQIIEYTTKIKVENKWITKEVSYLIQIDDEKSSWISDVEIPYSGNNKPDIKEAYILDANNHIVRRLKKKEIITKSNISRGSFYEDDYVKEFNLKWNSYPYRIRYTYSTSFDTFVHLADWTPQHYKNVPTRFASLEVDLPKNFKTRFDAPNVFTYDSIVSASRITYKWQIKDVRSVNKELYSPPYQNLIPSVTIVPLQFKFGEKGSFKTWTSYGLWAEELNAGLDILPESEQAKVDRLISGVNDKIEIIKTLYHYLQDNTRYINISIDLGGLKSYPASYVCENKYGDCKALTTYMKALLNYVGISSYYTFIYGDANKPEFNYDLPSHQFNHVILCVPVESDTIWLENTANYIPYNYLGTFTQDRFGLFTNGENSKLVKTPSLSKDDVLESSVYQYNLDESGEGKVKISQNLKGDSFENYSHAKKEYSEEDQLWLIKKKLPVENYKIVDWSITQANRDEASIKLELGLSVEAQFRKIGNMLTIQPIFDTKINFSSPKSRKNPVQVSFPINKVDSVVYNLPFASDYSIQLPKNELIESPFGSYEINYIVRDNQISYAQRFTLNKGYYTLEQYPDFYAFIEKIRTYRHSSIIILTPN